MDKKFSPYLQWIKDQLPTMTSLVEKWARINSWSDNPEGLKDMLAALSAEFDSLGGQSRIHSLPSHFIIGPKGDKIERPLGKALSIKKRPRAPFQIFLGGHMDTVYPPSHPLQTTSRKEDILKGPGVTDMKGGLVILLKVLETIERSPYADKIGWEVLINPDEEIGSPGSAPLFIEAAKRNQAGLIFEPSFLNGAFVSSRKGSANYAAIGRGKAAHAGRDFSAGRNAVNAIAHFVHEIEKMNQGGKITLNVGSIAGGGPTNIVPDFALCRFNLRASTQTLMTEAQNELNEILKTCLQQRQGINIQLIEESLRLPKPYDKKNRGLFKLYQHCAEELHIPFSLTESGGVTDGNILSAAGLPTLDSAGAIGGEIHTEDEYLYLPSLVERTQLSALFLMKLATGEISL